MESSTTLDTAFDVANEEGTPARELLPKGKYTAEITDATVGPTKRGNAQMVNLCWTITQGDHENRMVFQSIIIQHSDSPDAQRFGRQRFKDVCAACGITESVTDLGVLQFKPCTISVVIEEDKSGEYPPKNKVVRVMPLAPKGKPGNGELNDAIPF